MIVDQEQFDNFLQVLPELKNDQVYFVSLSARNKYLTMEEREEYHLGRTEMFGREIAKSKEDLEYKIKNVLPNKWNSMKTRKGKDIPEKCLVTYININPSSMVRSYLAFSKEMNNELSQITNAFMNGTVPNYEPLLKAKTKLVNAVQKSPAKKYFFDIDIDLQEGIKESKALNKFKETLKKDKIRHFVVETQGGIHILVDKENFPKGYPLYIKVSHLASVTNEIKEADFNSNMMIPVPGTLQAGKLVRIILGE